MASKVQVDVRFDGTDNVTPMLNNIKNQGAQLEQGINRTGKAFSVLSSGINEVNATIRQTNPAMAAAISSVDNFAISTVAAAASSRGWAGALGVLSSLLNPWTLLVIAAGAALAYFTAQQEAAKKKTEEMTKATDAFIENMAELRRRTELANATTERGQLLTKLEQERQQIQLKYYDDAIRLVDALRLHKTTADAEIAAFDRKAAEAAKIKAQSDQEATDAARSHVLKQIEEQRIQTIEIKYGAVAALEYKSAIAGNSEAIKKLGEEGKELAATLKRVTAETAAATYEAERYKALLDNLTKTGEAIDKQLEDEKKQIQDLNKARQDYNQTIREHQANLLRAAGAPEQSILAREIQLRRQEIEEIQSHTLTPETVIRLGELTRANEVANVQLLKLKDTAIDVAGEVSRVVTDITSAVISGTLKWADIGRSILASFVRVALEQFTGFLRVMQQVSQSGGILAAAGVGGGVGGAGAPGAPGGGGGGNILTQIAGSNPGTSINFIGSQLANLFPNTFGGLFGFGAAPAGVAGPSLASGGFFSTLSGAVANGVVNAIGTVSQSAATAVNSTLTAMSQLSWISWIPYIGWAIAAITSIYRIVSNQRERPNARLGGQFAGVAFDPETQQFLPGDIGVTIGRKVDIKNSVAGQIASNLQQRLTVLADQWVAILNIFPDMVSEDIIPALDEVNQRLNQNFANLKFSPGGRRSIQEELEAMSGPDGLVRFFNAFTPALGAGFLATLKKAGLGEVDVSGFQAISPGFKFPKEDWDKFIKAIGDVATLTSGLATAGASKFLTPTDIGSMGAVFNPLFATSDPRRFTELAGQLGEQLKPFTDFINQSMQESVDLLGKGIVGALESATASGAVENFTQRFHTGIKDAVFKGITDSFLATGVFNDFMAPLQKAIRAVIQETVDTGSYAADVFAQQVMPAIEEVLARANLLDPMLQDLQKFGDELKRRLGLAAVAEPIQKGLTDSAQLFGRSLVDVMNAVTGSPLDNFAASFNTAIKDAVFSGLVQTFLATGLVDEMLAPLQAALAQAVAQSRATGIFLPPDLGPIIDELSKAGQTFAPLIEFLSTLAGQVRTTLGLNPPPEPAPPEPAPTNFVINLYGVGNVDQSSIPDLARRLNSALEPMLSPSV